MTTPKPYPAYKDSGVEWLGQIPAHWEVWKVSHAFGRIGSGTTPPTHDISFYDGHIPWVTTSELRENVIQDTNTKLTDRALKELSALCIYPSGTLLMAMYGATIGRLGILGIPACTNQACCALANPGNLDTRFAFYWLLSRRTEIIMLSSGGGQPNINQEKLRALRIPAPSLAEQEAISAFLDRETVKIDELIAKKERLIALLQEKRAALISHAVTKGLDSNASMKDSGVEWLGAIPAHWAVAPVYARCQVQLGKMLDSERITGEHLAPYLRNVDVQWDSVNVENLPQMDFTASDRKRFALREGDLLVCEGGEVGRAAIWRGEIEECYYQKAIHRLRPFSDNDLPRFMFYVLFTAAKRGVFVAEGNPNTIDHLTAEKLRGHRFGFPPFSEQRAIAAYLDRETARIDAIIGKTQAHIELLRERRAALISAAVTGKIDVREARVGAS